MIEFEANRSPGLDQSPSHLHLMTVDPLRLKFDLLAWIRLGVLGLGSVAVLILSLDVATFADAIDRKTHQRNVERVKSSLFVLGETTVAEHLVLANSPEAYEQIHQRANASWIEWEFWPRAVLDEREHAFLIAADGNKMISRSSAFLSLSNEAGYLDAVRPLVEKLRDRFTSATAASDFEALFPGLYVHGLAAIEGHVSIVSAIAIAPSRIAQDATTHPPVLVHVTPINERVVKNLAEIALLPEIKLETASHVPPEGLTSLILDDIRGEAIGMLLWNNEQPGRTLLRAILPIFIVSALIVVLQSLATNRALGRIAKRVLAREADALKASRTDSATGLANRRWFHSAFKTAIAEQSDKALGVVLIDLDYFKSINDTMGHAAGDAVILGVADRLKSLSSRTIVAARLGGDEFAVITTPLAGPSDLAGFCEKLVATLIRPIDYNGQSINVSASIGAAMWPNDGALPDETLSAADLALYRAKRDGRGCARIYDAATDLSAALNSVAASAPERSSSRSTHRTTKRA